jgi:hypothetical protein
MIALDSHGKTRRIAMVLAGLVFAFIVAAAVAAPLLVYSAALAMFGAAHVLSELRYVDRRFGRRLGIPYAAALGPLLAGAVAARIGGVSGFLDPQAAIMLELSFVVALALAAAKGGLLQQVLAVGLALALGVATLVSPFDTAISLSILHNLTPLAFLWEISRPGSRFRVMGLALVAFIGLPLLVATGLPRLALAAAGVVAPSIDPFGAGPLANHLYVYVPIQLQHGGTAIDLFSASVVAQCAHYAAVILVLPAMLAANDPEAVGLVAWPRGRIFWAILIFLSSIAVYRFSIGFVSARALYGIAASLHAWVEIPLIIIAITRNSHQNSTTPVNAEARLAMPETISALVGDSPVIQPMIAASTTITTASVQPIVGQ